MATVPKTSPATWKSLVFHAVSIAILVNAFQTLKQPSPIAKIVSSQTGGWYQFLTVLGLCSAILTMALALVKDLIPSLRFVDYLKNAVGIVSVPLEGLIAVLYWGLRAYDPSLLVPPDPRYQIPLTLDLSLHAIPAILLWLDFLFLSPPFSEKSSPLLLSSLLTSAYSCWMEWCAQKNGMFAYPFLSDMTTYQRAAFYAASSIVNILLFYLANGIHFGVDALLGKNVRVAQQQAKGKRA